MAEKKDRILAPAIIETKQELLAALKSGQLAMSKYNTLTTNEKLFVELVAFGDYTAEQAIRVIDPGIAIPRIAANRLLANPAVSDTLEELTTLRDKKFIAEVASVRELALSKLKYIMTTTDDNALAAACAKTILDKSIDIMKQTNKGEDPVGNVTFRIQVSNINNSSEATSSGEPIIIPYGDNDVEKSTNTKSKHITSKNIKPELPYTMVYESVDSYTANQNQSEEDEEEDEIAEDDTDISV